MATYEIVPNEAQNYEGRQWGWAVQKDGSPYLEVTTGGTGPCWNIADIDEPDESYPLHICDLDELIDALTALRESEAHRQNVAHWAA